MLKRLNEKVWCPETWFDDSFGSNQGIDGEISVDLLEREYHS